MIEKLTIDLKIAMAVSQAELEFLRKIGMPDRQAYDESHAIMDEVLNIADGPMPIAVWPRTDLMVTGRR